MSAVVLDTCAVLWLAFGDPMQPTALASIRGAQASVSALVSPISAWEIAVKFAKGRLQLDVDPAAWFERFLQLPGIRLLDLTPQLLISSAMLPGQPPGDPADRIVIATARDVGAPVVTRDRLILAYAAAGYVAAEPC